MKFLVYRADALGRVAVRADDALHMATARMNSEDLRLLPVCDADGRFIGVLADEDVGLFLAGGGKAGSPIALAMNTAPQTINRDMDDHGVRLLMERRSLTHLPLVIDGFLRAMYVLSPETSVRHLTAVIMAGGLGQRLMPLTDDCPKPLLEVGGKPILSRIIHHLRDHGVSRLVLSLNYMADRIVDHYGDGSEYGVEIKYIRESSRLGTGGSLSLLDVAELSDPFLCLNGDLLSDLDVAELLATHQRRSWVATMVTRTHHYAVPYGVVRIGEDDEFMGADEKPTIQFPINAGLYMLSKSVLSHVPYNSFYDLPTLFSDLHGKGFKVGTFNHPGRWIDIGSAADLARARNFFKESE